jgi:hypothetical protein
MSNEDMKEYVSKRRQDTQNKIDKQVKIAKAYGIKVEEPHTLAKQHALGSCGNKSCLFCKNPRKAFGEKTIQEKKFDQTAKWSDEERIETSSDLCGND